jgi:hypothetical protein
MVFAARLFFLEQIELRKNASFWTAPQLRQAHGAFAACKPALLDRERSRTREDRIGALPRERIFDASGNFAPPYQRLSGDPGTSGGFIGNNRTYALRVCGGRQIQFIARTSPL